VTPDAVFSSGIYGCPDKAVGVLQDRRSEQASIWIYTLL
jgi:hypothetical protein